jgi:hypothetical protein
MASLSAASFQHYDAACFANCLFGTQHATLTVTTDSIVTPRDAVSMEALTTIALHYLIKIPVLLDNNFWGGRGAEREPQQGTRNAIVLSYHHSRYVLHTVTIM